MFEQLVIFGRRTEPGVMPRRMDIMKRIITTIVIDNSNGKSNNSKNSNISIIVVIVIVVVVVVVVVGSIMRRARELSHDL